MFLLQICGHTECSHEVKRHIRMQIFHLEAFSLKNNSVYSSLEVHAHRFLLAEHIT